MQEAPGTHQLRCTQVAWVTEHLRGCCRPTNAGRTFAIALALAIWRGVSLGGGG